MTRRLSTTKGDDIPPVALCVLIHPIDGSPRSPRSTAPAWRRARQTPSHALGVLVVCCVKEMRGRAISPRRTVSNEGGRIEEQSCNFQKRESRGIADVDFFSLHSLVVIPAVSSFHWFFSSAYSDHSSKRVRCGLHVRARFAGRELFHESYLMGTM